MKPQPTDRNVIFAGLCYLTVIVFGAALFALLALDLIPTIGGVK